MKRESNISKAKNIYYVQTSKSSSQKMNFGCYLTFTFTFFLAFLDEKITDMTQRSPLGSRFCYCFAFMNEKNSGCWIWIFACNK